MPNLKLNDKQEAFCLEYIADLNGTQAAIRAGYSEKTANRIASQLLTKLDIQERVQQLKLERSKRCEIDADFVLKSAKRIFDRCMQDEPILDRNGEHVMCKTEGGEMRAAYRFDANGANKALETIGKHTNVRAFDADKGNDNGEAQPLEINFNVKQPSAEIEVTRGTGD